jgi:hypothetical protein
MPDYKTHTIRQAPNSSITYVQALGVGFIGYVCEFKRGRYRAALFKKPTKTLDTAQKYYETTHWMPLNYRWDRLNVAIFALKNQYENSIKAASE